MRDSAVLPTGIPAPSTPAVPFEEGPTGSEVEQPIVLAVPPKHIVRLRARLGAIRKGRCDLALSEAELANLVLGEGRE